MEQSENQYFSQAVECLVNGLDTKIFRTRMRIQEILYRNTPGLRLNPFTNSHKTLSILMMKFLFAYKTEAYTVLSLREEHREIGENEPTLLVDVSLIGGESVEQDFQNAEFYEAYGYTKFRLGEKYEEFIRDVRKKGYSDGRSSVNINFALNGFSGTQLFFRRLDTSYLDTFETLPVIPETVS